MYCIRLRVKNTSQSQKKRRKRKKSKMEANAFLTGRFAVDLKKERNLNIFLSSPLLLARVVGCCGGKEIASLGADEVGFVHSRAS